MEQLEELKKILDDDEEVVLFYRPNKLRYLIIGNIVSTLFIISIGMIFFVFGLLILIGVIVGEGSAVTGGILIMVFGSIPILSALSTFIGRFISYKKVIYVATNKRLIIRSGIIGADYKMISLSTVGMMNVRVDLLDKLIHPNTGTIFFGTTSNPIINDNQGKSTSFKFEHLENPYEAYKSLKQLIPSK